MNTFHCNKLRELYYQFPDSFWKRLFDEIEKRVGIYAVEMEEGKVDVSTYYAFMDLLALEVSQNAVTGRRNALCLTDDERAWLLNG